MVPVVVITYFRTLLRRLSHCYQTIVYYWDRIRSAIVLWTRVVTTTIVIRVRTIMAGIAVAIAVSTALQYDNDDDILGKKVGKSKHICNVFTSWYVRYLV